MVFSRGRKDNIVQINSINDLKSRKFKPTDLNKKYIDKEGQEYKLKYDPIKKKVVIIKVIKGILDGKFIKDRFDNVISDDQIKEGVKKKLGIMGKQFLKDKYNISDHTKGIQEQQSTQPPQENIASSPDTEKKEARDGDIIKSFDGIIINSIEDVPSVVGKLSDRLEIVVKNILESNIFNQRDNYDDKVIVDDIRSLVKSNIIEEFRDIKEIYENVHKGFSDSKLEVKKSRDDLKPILADKSDLDQLSFLREIDGLETYKDRLDHIIKAFDDIDYKLSVVEGRSHSKTFHEKQKFSDAKSGLGTCKNDVIKILKYINKARNNKLNI